MITGCHDRDAGVAPEAAKEEKSGGAVKDSATRDRSGELTKHNSGSERSSAVELGWITRNTAKIRGVCLCEGWPADG